jgi:hypothetical protein
MTGDLWDRAAGVVDEWHRLDTRPLDDVVCDRMQDQIDAAKAEIRADVAKDPELRAVMDAQDLEWLGL